MATVQCCSWFSGAMIWDKIDGVHSFLLQEALTINPEYPQIRQVKFAGGTNKEHSEDRNPEDTLRRETKEELWLRLKHSASLPNPLVIPKFEHEQFFFLLNVDSFRGDIRNEVIYDEESRLEIPKWVSYLEAKKVIYSTHLTPLEYALRRLGLVV